MQLSKQKRGLLVSIEGIDGAGKSTISKLLHNRGFLSDQPVRVVHKSMKFGDDYLARHSATLASLLWGEQSEQNRSVIDDLHWLYLAASWYKLFDQFVVEPAISEGFVVVSDSSFYKILARFMIKAPPIPALAANILPCLRQPDVSIFLDVQPQVAAQRKKSFGYSESGCFDGYEIPNEVNFINYQSRVQQIYHSLAKQYTWTLVEPAGRSPESICAMIDSIIQKRLNE